MRAYGKLCNNYWKLIELFFIDSWNEKTGTLSFNVFFEILLNCSVFFLIHSGFISTFFDIKWQYPSTIPKWRAENFFLSNSWDKIFSVLARICTKLLLGHFHSAQLFGMCFRYQWLYLLVWYMRNITPGGSDARVVRTDTTWKQTAYMPEITKNISKTIHYCQYYPI